MRGRRAADRVRHTGPHLTNLQGCVDERAPWARSPEDRSTDDAAEAVGPRQPCPCGSGKRYKACHGSASGESPYVVRTFEGLAGECDWVALREFVPAGTAPLTLADDAFDGAAKGRTLVAASVLPGIAPALVRDNGDIWLATQVAHQSSDPSRDFAEALRLGLEAEPGDSVVMRAFPGLARGCRTYSTRRRPST